MVDDEQKRFEEQVAKLREEERLRAEHDGLSESQKQNKTLIATLEIQQQKLVEELQLVREDSERMKEIHAAELASFADRAKTERAERRRMATHDKINERNVAAQERIANVLEALLTLASKPPSKRRK